MDLKRRNFLDYFFYVHFFAVLISCYALSFVGCFFLNPSHWLPSEQNRSFHIKTRIRVPFVCVFFICFVCLFYNCSLWYPKDSVLYSSGKLLWKVS